MHTSPLLERLVEAGGLTSEYHGRTLVRHFGAPDEQYRAATSSCAVFDRSHRAPAVAAHVILDRVSDDVAFAFRTLARELPEMFEVQDARQRGVADGPVGLVGDPVQGLLDSPGSCFSGGAWRSVVSVANRRRCTRDRYAGPGVSTR